MINAFLYLHLTTIRNSLVQRCRRLRQPKYLFGALVGGAYFYFFFFRRILHGSPRGAGATVPATMPPELAPYLVSFGALILLVIVVVAWVIPSGRAALQFTEAEVAFLFPAPVTRRRLIHFKLLRSQFGILVSTFFLSLIFRPASFLGGHELTHAVGWWLILSTLNLHFIGASFAREQLLDLGLHPARRRALALGILAALVGGSWWWISRHVPPPTAADYAGPAAMIRYFGGVLQHPPVGWLLAPFALIAGPYFAPGIAGFFAALLPALLVIAAHYAWVMRADVSFEEASIDQARHLAEKEAAARTGDGRATRNQPDKARPTPFPLAPSGPVAVAFLWKNLIALGPFFRVRTWLIFVGLIAGFHVWTGTTGRSREFQMIAAVIPLAIGGWLLIMGPMIMRRDLRLMLTHFDLLKSYPLRGWQVVLGSLLPSISILAAIEWLLLLLAAPNFGSTGNAAWLAAGVLGTGSLGIALVLPPLVGLMLSIPFAATLYFPAWAESTGHRGGGIEVMGQRLIFFAGYILVLLVALLPAVLCGGLAAFIVHWLAGTVAAIVATALTAGVILGAEFGAVTWWLGERFERFDLSTDMPRS